MPVVPTTTITMEASLVSSSLPSESAIAPTVLQGVNWAVSAPTAVSRA